METKVTSPAIKGVIISLVLIIFSLVIQFMKLTQNKGIGGIGMLIFFGAIIWCCINYSNQMNANVTYGNVFTHAFKTTAAITAIMVVFTVISLKLLFPDSLNEAMRQAESEMEKGNMPEDQMETAMNFTRKFFVPLAIGGALLGYMIIGVIASLIGAAVAKKNPQTPFTPQG